MEQGKETKRRRVGRPQKAYIKGKEPVRNWLSMQKEEWDFTPGETPADKGESIRFVVRLIYGDGRAMLQWIDEQISALNSEKQINDIKFEKQLDELKFEKQLDDLRFKKSLEVLMEKRAMVNTMSETFARVRRDYPAFAFKKMIETSINESRSPDPKYYLIIWGITCDIEKVLQDREDLRFQFYDKETAGWESKYNVKKGPHGKREDELLQEMVNKELENNPKETK